MTNVESATLLPQHCSKKYYGMSVRLFEVLLLNQQRASSGDSCRFTRRKPDLQVIITLCHNNDNKRSSY